MSRVKTKTRRTAAKVTAPVTAPDPEQAAYDLLAKSSRFIVGLAGDDHRAQESAHAFGRLTGKMDGFQAGIMAPRTPGELRAQEQAPRMGKILSEVFREVKKAVSKHGPMHSGHEGYAVIQEEVDELWDEIKADRGKMASARAEAIQVAAMAVRYVLDLDPR